MKGCPECEKRKAAAEAPKDGWGMLVLTRRMDEGLLIDDKIAIRFEKKSFNAIKCTIYAPRTVKVDRLECTGFKLPPGRANA